MATPGHADALAFNAALRRLDTLAECTALFSETIAPFGFTKFAAGEIDLDRRRRSAFFVLAWPEEWHRYYFENKMVERDMVYEAMRVWSEPFTWADIARDPRFAEGSAPGLKRNATFGWLDGLVVPVSRRGSRIGSVTMACTHVIPPEDIAFLSLISICLHGHARTLVGTCGFAVPPGGLTQREIDCLRLVARGHSDRTIAGMLGIAASTAHEHVENARRKLDTKSRAETIAVTVALGVIEM